jgi:hypothetical protein
MARYVGVLGTHSTGKSTFLTAVREALESTGQRVGSVADHATNCRAAGFPILRDHTFESTLWIMSSVIRAELEAGRTNDVVLVDRPVPDALGYLEAALACQNRSISPAERDYVYSLARMHGSRYEVLFRTVLDPTIPLGPGRDGDLVFRRSVDAELTKVVAKVDLMCHRLAPTGTERAIREVVNLLSGVSGLP